MAVALKVDEAPLVINRGFADTMALKRSAGLETVACWQTDAQWVDRDVRAQLDALFAHRVYFATASVEDARAGASLMMAQFVDSVRSGEREPLSALGRPDARLHLPRHHAIVSWTTPEGRQPPFVAQTIPLRVDPARLAAHAARQTARGGRYLADLRQPHWDAGRVDGVAAPPAARNGVPTAGDQATPAVVASAAPSADPDGAAAVPPSAVPAAAPPPGPVAPTRPTGAADGPPRTPPPSFRELVDVDGAQRARWTPSPRPPARAATPDALDLEILLLVARLGHVLSSQVHRRHQPARSLTTTQRRLKRLAEAGWVSRFQFHRADGGGVPMCCVIREAGLDLLAARDRLPAAAHGEAPAAFTDGSDIDLRRARREVHVAGWVLALQRCVGEAQYVVARRVGERALADAPRGGPPGRRRPR